MKSKITPYYYIRGRNRSVSPKTIRYMIKSGYDMAKGHVNDVNSLTKGRYHIDEKHTNSHQTVWRDTKDYNRPIITFPGTNPFCLRDIISDLYVATGMEHLDLRFVDAKNCVAELRIESGMEPTLISHSLGASVNEYVGRYFPNIKQININKGAGIGSIGRNQTTQQTDIHVWGDCISCLGCCNSCVPTGTNIQIFPTINNLFCCFGSHRFDNIHQLSESI